MATSVEVAFTLTTDDQPWFRIGDPVKGRLDNATYRLAGPQFIDISADLLDVSVVRGKNRDLDRYSAGQANVVLNNQSRAYDPLYPSSPYVGNIVPRREIRISTDNYVQFTGVIDDWNFQFTPEGRSVAEIVASDAFSLLARQSLTAGTATPQLSGARVSAVLDMPSVDWPSENRDIDEGVATLGADVFEGNALDYLTKVETSEQGGLFIGREGRIKFRDRSVYPTTDELVTFADDGSGIPFSLTAVNYGTELLFNQIVFTSDAGTAVADSITSQEEYGISSKTFDTLISTQEQLDELADFIINKYEDPEYRFERIAVRFDSLSGAQKEQLLQLDLNSVIKVQFTPNNIGDPIEQYGEVIRIAHQVTESEHVVEIGMASLDYTLLVFDDLQFGKLDLGALSF